MPSFFISLYVPKLSQIQLSSEHSPLQRDYMITSVAAFYTVTALKYVYISLIKNIEFCFVKKLKLRKNTYSLVNKNNVL